jgi:tetratricopeptide (TPR) repeat protein
MPLPEDDPMQQITMLTNAIDAASNNVDRTRLHVERGHWYERAGDPVNSVRDFLNALDTAENPSDIVHIKSMIALALALKDEKEQALFWAMGAVDEDPTNAEAHHTLGLICDRCGYLNLAIASLERAISIDPRRWDSLRVLGMCLRENGRIQEAIEVLSRYVDNNQDEPRGLYELGWSLHLVSARDDNLPKVKGLYEKALEHNPGPELRTTIERKLQLAQSYLAGDTE